MLPCEVDDELTELDRINGIVQERRYSSALAMELRLSCIKPSACYRIPQATLSNVNACILIQIPESERVETTSLEYDSTMYKSTYYRKVSSQ